MTIVMAYCIIKMIANIAINEVAVKSLTIRGIDPVLNQKIREAASLQGMSVNKWVLAALRKITGTDKELLVKEYRDLDPLAGGWSEADAEEFLRNTAIFENVDAELWQ